MARTKTDKNIKKDKKPKAEKPRIETGEPDLSTKRKLVAKLKQQAGWEERSLKECQLALEEVKWDYNAIFQKKKKRRKSVKEVLTALENGEDISEEENEEEVPYVPIDEGKKKESKYIQGLDSAWVLSYKSDWKPSDLQLLANVNKKLGTNYESWNELSEKHTDLSEEFLTQYEGYVSFYHLFKTHNPDNYSAKFKKKMKDHFLIADLDLVPRNYKRERDEIKTSIEED